MQIDVIHCFGRLILLDPACSANGPKHTQRGPIPNLSNLNASDELTGCCGRANIQQFNSSPGHRSCGLALPRLHVVKDQISKDQKTRILASFTAVSEVLAASRTVGLGSVCLPRSLARALSLSLSVSLSLLLGVGCGGWPVLA